MPAICPHSCTHLVLSHEEMELLTLVSLTKKKKIQGEQSPVAKHNLQESLTPSSSLEPPSKLLSKRPRLCSGMISHREAPQESEPTQIGMEGRDTVVL